MPETKKEIISQLQKKILLWEGFKPPEAGKGGGIGLGPVEQVFPNGVFPLAAIHEIVCASTEEATAAVGFVSGILSALMKNGGICVWIGRTKGLFAPSLSAFSVPAHNMIFINLVKDNEALWVMEEALKCSGLTAVVCELREMDFKQSRRFQLAVEQSRVTGFVFRNKNKPGSTACAARWHIRSSPSSDLEGLPGLGYLRWQVELLKVRNGETGQWILEWQNNCFVPVEEIAVPEERQVG